MIDLITLDFCLDLEKAINETLREHPTEDTRGFWCDGVGKNYDRRT